MKDINIPYYFIREQLLPKSFTLSYIPAAENTADIITKNLSFIIYYTHMNSLRLSECERVSWYILCVLIYHYFLSYISEFVPCHIIYIVSHRTLESNV